MVAGGLCDKHATLLSDDSASALRNSIADSIEKHRAEIQCQWAPWQGGLSKLQDVGAGKDPGSQPGSMCLQVRTWGPDRQLIRRRAGTRA